MIDQVQVLMQTAAATFRTDFERALTGVRAVVAGKLALRCHFVDASLDVRIALIGVAEAVRLVETVEGTVERTSAALPSDDIQTSVTTTMGTRVALLVEIDLFDGQLMVRIEHGFRQVQTRSRRHVDRLNEDDACSATLDQFQRSVDIFVTTKICCKNNIY